MSNQQSALTRSNMRRNGALAVAGAIAPRVANALIKAAVDRAVSAIRGGPSNQTPVWTPQNPQPRVGGRRRRGRGNQGGGNSQSSTTSGTTTITRSVATPDVRRLLRGIIPLSSDTTGKVATIWTVAVGQASNISAWPLLGQNIMGANVAAFTGLYNLCRINKVTVRFIPALPPGGTVTFQYGMGYSRKSTVSAPTSLVAFTDYAQFVIGSFGSGDLSFQPHNAHGGVVPVSGTASDDFNEEAAGAVTFYGTISPTQAINFGVLFVEADVMLMDS